MNGNTALERAKKEVIDLWNKSLICLNAKIPKIEGIFDELKRALKDKDAEHKREMDMGVPFARGKNVGILKEREKALKVMEEIRDEVYIVAQSPHSTEAEEEIVDAAVDAHVAIVKIIKAYREGK